MFKVAVSVSCQIVFLILVSFTKNKIKSQNCLICISLMIKDVIFKQILSIFQSFQVHLRIYSFGL